MLFETKEHWQFLLGYFSKSAASFGLPWLIKIGQKQTKEDHKSCEHQTKITTCCILVSRLLGKPRSDFLQRNQKAFRIVFYSFGKTSSRRHKSMTKYILDRIRYEAWHYFLQQSKQWIYKKGKNISDSLWSILNLSINKPNPNTCGCIEISVLMRKCRIIFFYSVGPFMAMHFGLEVRPLSPPTRFIFGERVGT